ncbi:ABC transporter permease subunit [Alkalicoccobacillus murimartini]|uniref:ABC-2 type transport system permease protein n=1 Tax=Alkalicoccobacillus murimartini TaxID=171685 RepID=A0ABT9YH39_9BACI|nr:ABC transporter permease subunit [Alkalicoccobacillus murimartini]MDQ0207011.1 ABC-2 type transport system permease protein [Alkalicoccobacillus murimartini]
MFLSLLQNEWIKTYYRNKFMVFSIIIFSLLLFGVGATLFFENYDFGENAVPVDPVGSLGFALGALNSMSVFVLVFSVVIIISSIVGEYKSGTMKQLLIRPISRTQVLLSKWVVAFIVSLGMFVAIAAIGLLLGAIFFSFDTSVIEAISTLGLWILYNMPALFFYQAFALCLAVLTRSSALSLSSVIVLYFVGNIVFMFLLEFDWSRFIILANLSLQDYSSNVHLQVAGGPLLEGMTLGFSLTMIAIYSFVLLLVPHIIFKKRDVLS